MTTRHTSAHPRALPAVHAYPAHVEAVLSKQAPSAREEFMRSQFCRELVKRGYSLETNLPPTTPKFGHSFASPQYRIDKGLTVGGRYDWVLLVAAILACALVLAGLSFAFH